MLEENMACAQEVMPATPSEEEMLQHRAQQAVYVLREAAKVRADAALMGAVRAVIQKERDDLMHLLDAL